MLAMNNKWSGDGNRWTWHPLEAEVKRDLLTNASVLEEEATASITRFFTTTNNAPGTRSPPTFKLKRPNKWESF